MFVAYLYPLISISEDGEVKFLPAKRVCGGAERDKQPLSGKKSLIRDFLFIQTPCPSPLARLQGEPRSSQTRRGWKSVWILSTRISLSGGNYPPTFLIKQKTNKGHYLTIRKKKP